MTASFSIHNLNEVELRQLDTILKKYGNVPVYLKIVSFDDNFSSNGSFSFEILRGDCSALANEIEEIFGERVKITCK